MSHCSSALRRRALALVSAAACSKGSGGQSPSGMGGSGVVRCGSDVQCADGACLGGNCIPRVTSGAVLAVEIRPPSTSTAPVTERTQLSSSGPLALSTDRPVAVHVTFNASSPSAVPSVATVVLSVRSLIGGQPDLTFVGGVDSSAVTFQAPESALARAATVDLTPISPANQQSPPFSFPIDTLAQDNNLTIPTNNVWLSGVLHDAVDQIPSRPFVARAYQQGRLVSNISIITGSGGADADGCFDWRSRRRQP